MTQAEVHRQSRPSNPTRAELAFAEMLDCQRILYEREKIFLNGDRYIICDFFFKSKKQWSNWMVLRMTDRRVTTPVGMLGCCDSME